MMRHQLHAICHTAAGSKIKCWPQDLASDMLQPQSLTFRAATVAATE
jgi:hypothetical protein